ncbi:MAG TPA: RnfH family protein [Burkholderiales bacterium]|jgi:putative ubiquitin-RnfH superfamily antitoxin RatB of RatAB toxin-antitoxin module|nr:RnfH family protein [Burkholderiales bacterium]
MLRVEVVYATPAAQGQYAVDIREGATVRDAVERSGVLRDFPQIDLACDRVGIHGRLVALEDPLRDGDRVEILRPLVADPNTARSRRARAARRPR